MGTVTTTHWVCDRCGAQEDEKPIFRPNLTVAVHRYEEWSGGAVIDWKEMCKQCVGDVDEALKFLWKRRPAPEVKA